MHGAVQLRYAEPDAWVVRAPDVLAAHLRRTRLALLLAT
jgi:hypothetical protein